MPVRISCLMLLLGGALTAPRFAAAQVITTITNPAQEAREELKNRADAAYRAGNHTEAIRLLDQVLAQDAKDHVALYLRGSAKVGQGESTKDPALIRSGISDARAALGISNNIDYYLPYLYGMSRLAAVEGRPEHASAGVAAADKVLGRAAGDQKANLYFQRSLLNQALGDNNAAKQDLRNAVTVAPKNLAAQTALTNIIYAEGNQQASEQQFDAAVAAIPDQSIVYNNRGNFLSSIGRIDEAIRDYGKAIELDPKYVPSLTSRGYLLIMQQKYAAAEKDLTQSLQIDNKQPTAFGLRAAAQLHLGKKDAALQDYRTAVTLNPTNAAGFYDLGFAQFCARDYAGARESFDQAVRLDPSIQFLAPWRYTAMVFASQRDQALAEFSALERVPEDKRTWFDVLTLFLMGKLNEDAVFAAIDKSKPDGQKMQTCDANYFIGLRFASRNQPDQARQYFEKSIASGQRHLASFRGAMYAVGQYAPE